MTLTRRQMLCALAAGVSVKSLFPNHNAELNGFTEALNDRNGAFTLSQLEIAYNTAWNGGRTEPDLCVVSPRIYCYMQYLEGHPNSGWGDYVKSDIRKRLSTPRVLPDRLPA